jgi:hypothetical protein
LSHPRRCRLTISFCHMGWFSILVEYSRYLYYIQDELVRLRNQTQSCVRSCIWFVASFGAANQTLHLLFNCTFFWHPHRPGLSWTVKILLSMEEIHLRLTWFRSLRRIWFCKFVLCNLFHASSPEMLRSVKILWQLIWTNLSLATVHFLSREKGCLNQLNCSHFTCYWLLYRATH